MPCRASTNDSQPPTSSTAVTDPRPRQAWIAGTQTTPKYLNRRTTPVSSRSTLRQDVQGLRGIAVLLVVLYHAGLSFLPGGFIGVDVFFAISGFLITGLLVRDYERHGHIDYATFIARRSRRLLPGALAMVIGVALTAPLVFPPIELVEVLSATRAAALYVANLWFAGRAVDYLGGGAATSPMLHTWSLAVEEQFYLGWPLLVLLAARCWPAADTRRRVMGLVIVASIASWLACIAVTQLAQPWAFFGTPMRAWEFGVGALAFLLSHEPDRLPKAVVRLIGVAGALAVAGAATLLNERLAFPGVWAALPACGTAMMLFTVRMLPDDRWLSSILATRPLARAGDVSYSWYLWHWPLLVALPLLRPQSGPLDTAVVVVLSYVMAEASYRFIEEPVRHGRFVSALPSRVVLLAAASLTLVTAGALTLAKQRTEGIPPNSAQAVYMAAQKDIPAVYAKGCHVAFPITEAKACTVGPADARPVVVLVGDSHAAHWYPALERIAQEQGWQLLSMTKSSCSWVDVPVVLPEYRRRYHECETWRGNVLERLRALRPALVVLGGAHHYEIAPEQWAAGVTRTLAAIESLGARAAVLRDTPRPGFRVPICLARAEGRGADPAAACSYDRAKGLAMGREMSVAELGAIRLRPLAAAIDLNDRICADDTCSPLAGSLVRFSDDNHLAASYSRSLAPALQQQLMPLLQAGAAKP